MREETRQKVDAFLTERGCDPQELKTDKQVLNKLVDIAVIASVDVDYEYMIYEKMYSNKGLASYNYSNTLDEQLEKVHNFELIERNANIYASQIRFERKEERKLLRKEKFQKVLSMFGIKR